MHVAVKKRSTEVVLLILVRTESTSITEYLQSLYVTICAGYECPVQILTRAYGTFSLYEPYLSIEVALRMRKKKIKGKSNLYFRVNFPIGNVLDKQRKTPTSLSLNLRACSVNKIANCFWYKFAFKNSRYL